MNIIDSIKTKLRKYHLDPFVDVGLFVIILLVFHFIWKLLASNIMAIEFIGNSSEYMSAKVFQTSQWLVNVLNINVNSYDQYFAHEAWRNNVFHYLENDGFVYVNRSCSGLKQFYQWSFLILLYPGPWKHKLWYWPMGLIIIHIVNILRILGMILTTIHFAEHWDFVHDYVFRPLFYIVMFGLWVFWNERFYLKNKKST